MATAISDAEPIEADALDFDAALNEVAGPTGISPPSVADAGTGSGEIPVGPEAQHLAAET